MKQNVVILLALLLLCNSPAPAEGFRLEAGHFTVNGGPLTVSDHNNIPIPDGCKGQILADTSGDGIMPPRPDGSPAPGDALMSEYLHLGSDKEDPAVFSVNGLLKLSSQGSFVSDAINVAQLPDRMIWVRVFNAPNPAEASAYWDSPLYQIVPGPQQISFARSEWTFHPFHASNIDDASKVVTMSMNAFPNPFNASSRIEFALERASNVELAVFDIQGRLVRTLVSEIKARGTYTVLFDAEALTSGIYFLRMQRDGKQTYIQRLHLVR